MILLIVAAPQTLLTPDTKEVVADAACGGAWVNRTPRRVIRTGVDGSTPGDVCNDVSIKHATSPVLIVIVATSSPYGLSMSLQVAKKRQPMSPGLDSNTQKMDAVVDEKLPDNLDSASIFSKAISHKISNGSRRDLYSGCRMNSVNDPVQTQAPNFMDMGLPAINTFNEIGVLSTPSTSI